MNALRTQESRCEGQRHLSLHSPRSRTVLAVQGSLRRAETRAPWTPPGRSEDRPKEGKGSLRKRRLIVLNEFLPGLLAKLRWHNGLSGAFQT